jgi:hypothetical protein
MRCLLSLLLALTILTPSAAAGPAGPKPRPDHGLIRSRQSGPWSAPATWQGGKVPGPGARVQVRPGHVVVYDLHSDRAIRSIHVGGTLTFATDCATRLDVGLILIRPGEDATESGFECGAHVEDPDPKSSRPALEVGTPARPVAAGRTALIRLTYFAGMDQQSFPAIVCCGGRMDFHGAPMNRTWVRLGATATKGESAVTLAEPVSGWRVGDRVLLPSTSRQIKAKKTFRPSVRDNTQTEERFIKAIDGTCLVLDRPLAFDHRGEGEYRGEVANLSRNVVVESADPGARGHTMYHRHSAGAISYAEFRRLGKEGVLGRYSLHFHLVRDTMRGSYVLGASIWDSGNRWLTIHGTNYLVVRDCVGYRSVGHGFFLEDGTEVFNVLDRNLAVHAYAGKPLPDQVLAFDQNDGAGFWWANCLNTFTRNVAVECDEYGYFFQVLKTAKFDPVLPVMQPDGSRKRVDVRTLPFVRFEGNEAHCQRRHALNLGGFGIDQKVGVGGVGPDEKHPFVLRDTRLWDVHWPFHTLAPCVLVDGMDIWTSDYETWRSHYDRHAYRKLRIRAVTHPSTLVAERGPPRPKEADFPGALAPVDDLPPVTVITHVLRQAGGKLLVRGTTSDNGTVKRVLVNGQAARALRPDFAEWEVVLSAAQAGRRLRAHAEDAAGNVEKRAHVVEEP